MLASAPLTLSAGVQEVRTGGCDCWGQNLESFRLEKTKDGHKCPQELPWQHILVKKNRNYVFISKTVASAYTSILKLVGVWCV